MFVLWLLFFYSRSRIFRSSINTTAQLAHAIKPVLEYDERRLSLSGQGQAQDVFEARCFVWSRLEELKGLIVVKEAKGVSIKAARERAAQKIVQYLLYREGTVSCFMNH